MQPRPGWRLRSFSPTATRNCCLPIIRPMVISPNLVAEPRKTRAPGPFRASGIGVPLPAQRIAGASQHRPHSRYNWLKNQRLLPSSGARRLAASVQQPRMARVYAWAIRKTFRGSAASNNKRGRGSTHRQSGSGGGVQRICKPAAGLNRGTRTWGTLTSGA